MANRSEQMIQNLFDVQENEGKLYLTCYGYAFKEFLDEVSAKDIASEVSKARKAAVELWKKRECRVEL